MLNDTTSVGAATAGNVELLRTTLTSLGFIVLDQQFERELPNGRTDILLVDYLRRDA